MGPYCNFCDRRCFLPRIIPGTTGTVLMATCPTGMSHDRKVTGFDHTTAINSAERTADAMLNLVRGTEMPTANGTAGIFEEIADVHENPGSITEFLDNVEHILESVINDLPEFIRKLREGLIEVQNMIEDTVENAALHQKIADLLECVGGVSDDGI